MLGLRGQKGEAELSAMSVRWGVRRRIMMFNQKSSTIVVFKLVFLLFL